MNTKRFAEQLTALVGAPSISSANADLDQSNLPVLALLATWLEDLGFHCDIQAIAGHPGKANLVAVKGSGDHGLVLAGHTDTVPCNPERWQQDPFTLTDKDNRFYGLGATDMKGFFPVVLAALEQFKSAQLQQPIIVLATADEESSMCGARALATAGHPLGRYAIIGEPTGLRPIRMHKGIMFESVRVVGQAGHSSNPKLGVNALEVMNVVITELLQLRSELQARYHHPGFAVPEPTLNLGCIHGGDSPNRICGSCEMHFDLRLVPGMQLEPLREQIQTRLRAIAERSGTDMVFHSLFPGIEPYEQKADSQIVLLTQKLTGHQSESVAFATEAPFLQKLGMETVVMGPGSIDQAHQPDEYIAHSEIVPAVNVLTGLIQTLCQPHA